MNNNNVSLDTTQQRKLALEIATAAHEGQTYGDTEYIRHPLVVSEALQGYGDVAYIAGILHDTLEDSDYSAQDLIDLGIDRRVVETVEYVTRPNDGTYLDWIRDIASTNYPEDLLVTLKVQASLRAWTFVTVPSPVLVKLADNIHNSLPYILGEPVPEDKASLEKRYARAREILGEGLPDALTLQLVRDVVRAHHALFQ